MESAAGIGKFPELVDSLEKGKIFNFCGLVVKATKLLLFSVSNNVDTEGFSPISKVLIFGAKTFTNSRIGKT